MHFANYNFIQKIYYLNTLAVSNLFKSNINFVAFLFIIAFLDSILKKIAKQCPSKLQLSFTSFFCLKLRMQSVSLSSRCVPHSQNWEILMQMMKEISSSQLQTLLFQKPNCWKTYFFCLKSRGFSFRGCFLANSVFVFKWSVSLDQ